MDEKNLLAERFEAHRTRLRGVAYRMLGISAGSISLSPMPTSEDKKKAGPTFAGPASIFTAMS